MWSSMAEYTVWNRCKHLFETLVMIYKQILLYIILSIVDGWKHDGKSQKLRSSF